MEREGLKLDAERLAEVGAGFGERIETLESEIFELAEEEFTIGSPQQVGRILFEKLGLTRKRRGKTGFSTDARVLAQIRDEHPIVEKIESWRELTKLKNTYLDSLPDLIDPETGRVHTTFNQASTTTGRLSSTNPNLQNIPIRTEIGRPVRACFVAERGARLLSADYSQVELRVLAHVADEEVLKEIFRGGRRRPRRDRGRGLRHLRATRSTSASARRRRWSTSGSSTGSPASASPTGSTSRAKRGRNSSPATSSASRRCAPSASRSSSAPRRRAT